MRIQGVSISIDEAVHCLEEREQVRQVSVGGVTAQWLRHPDGTEVVIVQGLSSDFLMLTPTA